VLTLVWDGSVAEALTALAADPAVRSGVDRRLGRWGQWRGLAADGWAPSEIRLRAPFPFVPEAYLGSLGLRFTRRRAPQGYRLELTPAARRKGLLGELAWWSLPDGGSQAILQPGPKLLIEQLLRHGYQLPGPEQWVRVEAQVIGP
jgi:hypothetical protein